LHVGAVDGHDLVAVAGDLGTVITAFLRIGFGGRTDVDIVWGGPKPAPTQYSLWLTTVTPSALI
jgi:hypothetical protein